MRMPPYNQLMQELKHLVDQYPVLRPTLLPVINYLAYTSNIYEEVVLNSVSHLDDEDDEF